MKISKICSCIAGFTTLVLAGCGNDAARHQPISIVLKAEKGEPVTLQIPRGYIEQPKDPEEAKAPLANVLLRIPNKDLAGPDVFVGESEIRVLIEPKAGNADAAHELQAAALRRPKASEDAILKSD